MVRKFHPFFCQSIDVWSLKPDLTITTQITIIRALLYPGIVLLCLGITGLYVYYTRMKIHIQIITPQESYQLYSEQHNLNDLLTLHENIRSGDITPPKGIISEISNEQRLSEKPVVTFDDIKVKIAFKDEDILHLAISDEKEAGSIELSLNVTAELNQNGELIGIEILEASSFIRDSILESAQAKMLDIVAPYNKRVEPTS